MNKKLLKLSFAENKLFFRILLYFLSLLLPIIIVGGIFYFNYTKNLKNEFSEKIHLNLISNVELIDNSLQTTEEINTGFLLDANVRSILSPFDQYTTHEKVQLTKIINALSHVSSVTASFVDNIFVYIDNKKIYTSSGIDNYNSFFKYFYHFDKYDGDFWEQLLHVEQHDLKNIMVPSLVKTINSKTVNVIPIIIKDKIKGNNVVMVTTVPVERISAILKNNAFLSSTDYIVLDDQNRVILSSGLNMNSAITSHLTRLFQNQQIEAQTRINNKSYMVNQVKSKYFGWTYYAVTPVQAVNNQAERLVRMLLFICMAVFIISIFISFVFTLKIYSPIKKIRDLLVKKDDTLEMNDRLYKHELDLIGSGIHKLLDSNQSLNLLSMDYIESSLDYLIKGNYLQNESNLKKVLNTKLGFDTESYICCTFKFAFKDQFFSEIDEVDRFIILHKLKKMIGVLLNHYLKSFVLEYDQYLYVCIINVRPKERIKLQKALDHIAEVFANDLNYCSIAIAVGRMHIGLRGIAESYVESMTALDGREKNAFFQIIDSEKLSIKQQFFYSLMDENKIMNCIKAGDWELFESELLSIFQINKDRGVSFHYMNLLLAELYNTGKKITAERALDTSKYLTDAEEYILSSKIDFPIHFEEKEQMIISFFKKMIDEIAGQNEQNSSNIVSDMIKYIENNFHNDLYLDKISEAMGLSSKYISRHFKEKMGINLTDYISQIRIQKAKQLLSENPDIKIKNLSEQVGIFSRMTFLRLFRKYEGVSPNEYKEMIKKKEA